MNIQTMGTNMLGIHTRQIHSIRGLKVYLWLWGTTEVDWSLALASLGLILALPLACVVCNVTKCFAVCQANTLQLWEVRLHNAPRMEQTAETTPLSLNQLGFSRAKLPKEASEVPGKHSAVLRLTGSLYFSLSSRKISSLGFPYFFPKGFKINKLFFFF